MSGMRHNPLELGTPYGSSTSLSSPSGDHPSQSAAHLPPIGEPTTAQPGSLAPTVTEPQSASPLLETNRSPMRGTGEEADSETSSPTLGRGPNSYTKSSNSSKGDGAINEEPIYKHGRSTPDCAAEEAQAMGVGREKDNEEKSDQPTPLVPRRTERSATLSRINRKVQTSSGGEMATGYGMMPIGRQVSLPPGVGPFGGSAPSGEDAELGLRAVRSREEELKRESERERKGPDPFAVRFEPGEAANPKNWGVGYRWGLTAIAGLLVLNSTFASSAPSGIVGELQEEFGFSREVAVLTISLFVAGYCLGPLLWGPLSEAYGRRPLFIISFICYTGFQVGCALSPNTASILIFRFLGGTFASAPLTNSGAVLADIWDGDHRGQAMCLFALAPFAGPSIGPIVSGYIAVSGASWRLVFWALTGFAGFCLLVIIFFVPETYAPAILTAKAVRLRKETGDDRWYAPLERADRSFKQTLHSILAKPFIMLAQEPMLLAITLYMSFVYGVVYLLFEAVPFVFVQVHGFNTGENGLAFLGLLTGGTICVFIYIFMVEPRYQRHAAKMAPLAPVPEKRLELSAITAWCLVIAMFWFGWTGAYRSIHWVSPLLAMVLLVIGVLGMFVTLFNYIIDVYLWSAASALAATTVCRSIFGAGFPLFAGQMYTRLGIQWASSLLGFLALLMAPIPLVLIRYGPTLRKHSKYAPSV